MARQYHTAANTLYGIAKDVPAPVYFLYAHTLELAFKAYLQSFGCSAPPIHSLESLCERCRARGLHVNREIVDTIRLLESENAVHGFRYFAFVATGIPEIGYLREIVDDLMRTVAEETRKKPGDDLRKGVVFKITVGKPVQKRRNPAPEGMHVAQLGH